MKEIAVASLLFVQTSVIPHPQVDSEYIPSKSFHFISACPVMFPYKLNYLILFYLEDE